MICIATSTLSALKRTLKNDVEFFKEKTNGSFYQGKQEYAQYVLKLIKNLEKEFADDKK